MRFAQETGLTAGDTLTHTVPANEVHHQLQLTVFNGSGTRTVPGAGTLTVDIKAPYASEFEQVLSVDLTSASNWIQFLKDTVATEFQFSVSSLDSNHTLDIHLASLNYD